MPGLDGIQTSLAAAAAIAANIEAATTVASILGGTIVTSGPLNVYGESHVVATSHAYSQTVTSGGGLATALAINVEVDAITAVVGGPTTITAPSMTVEALTVLSNGDPGPAVANALAISGGNGSSTFTSTSLAGAFALNVATGVYVALVMDPATFTIPGAVLVEALTSSDMWAHALSNVNAATVGGDLSAGVGYGPSIAFNVSTQVTLAWLAGGTFNPDSQRLLSDERHRQRERHAHRHVAGDRGRHR